MFVVLDWVDGSWKATQTQLTIENLKNNWYKADNISFPSYWHETATFVEKFLNKEFWDPETIDPLISSSFYILDRFWQKQKLLEKINQNDYLISDRYSTANFIHRGTKYLQNNDIEWLEFFFDRLEEFEFQRAKLPKPDIIIFLSLGIENIQNLIKEKVNQNRNYIKNGELDEAEKNIQHQKLSLEIWKNYLPKYFDNFYIVECEDKQWNILSKEEINSKILNLIT